MHADVQQSPSSLSSLLGSFPIPELLKHWGLITWHYENAYLLGGVHLLHTNLQSLIGDVVANHFKWGGVSA